MTTDPEEVLQRPAPPPDATVRYGDDPNHLADLRLPREQSAPLVVFVHGGFWRRAYDRQHAGPLAAALAALGHPVATVEYRRVGQPGGGWPGTVEDVARAVDLLPGLVAPFADPAGLVLAGHSAGGQLALVHAGRPAVGAVLALAPVADLGHAHALRLGADAVAALLGGGPADVPDRYALADPARLPPPTVPAAIVHGELDDVVPLDVSGRYAEWAGERCPLHVVPGAGHYGVIDPLSSSWRTVTRTLTEIIDRRPKRR